MTGVARTSLDWERIEADFRAGVLSLREIAARHGVTEGAIRKRSKKFGWTRDLTARIQAKADELVRRDSVRGANTQLRTASDAAKPLISEGDESTCGEPVRGVSTHGTQPSALTDEMVIAANAEAMAAVRLTHRKDIRRLRVRCLAMAEELDGVTSEQLPLPARSAAFKQLTDSLKSLIGLERQAWQLDAETAGAGTYDDFLAELYGENDGGKSHAT